MELKYEQQLTNWTQLWLSQRFIAHTMARVTLTTQVWVSSSIVKLAVRIVFLIYWTDRWSLRGKEEHVFEMDDIFIFDQIRRRLAGIVTDCNNDNVEKWGVNGDSILTPAGCDLSVSFISI